MTDGQQPLTGLRVIDASSLYAAPFISTLLADHGADVIKIEPPGGDPYRVERRPLWAILGRQKRSVTLDLRSEQGCDLLRRLVEHVDVLVVNLLPHQLERQGLTWERLSAVNPDLVLVCVTSYGLDGPNAHLPGSGTLGEAFAGLTNLTGDPDAKPMLASVPLGDAVTGWVGAFGVLAACYQRLNGGGGQVVDVNPVDSLLHLAAPSFTEWVPGEPPPTRLGGRLAGSPVRNTYRCADGAWVAISCSTPRHLEQLLELAGHRMTRDQEDDGTVDRAVAAWVAGTTRPEVVAELRSRRLPVAPVHDPATLHADPHIVARRALGTVASTELGPRVVAAPAPRFGSGGAGPARCADTGEHNRDVLGGLLGLDDDELARLGRAGVI
jgi:crotonobetainyl-CoA:carnitine CoA-transferase CaiB-like acyl-CoA transferase